MNTSVKVSFVLGALMLLATWSYAQFEKFDDDAIIPDIIRNFTQKGEARFSSKVDKPGPVIIYPSGDGHFMRMVRDMGSMQYSSPDTEQQGAQNDHSPCEGSNSCTGQHSGENPELCGATNSCLGHQSGSPAYGADFGSEVPSIPFWPGSQNQYQSGLSSERSSCYGSNSCTGEQSGKGPSSCGGTNSCTGIQSGSGAYSCSGPASCTGMSSGRGSDSCSGSNSCSGINSGACPGSCNRANSCSSADSCE